MTALTSARPCRDASWSTTSADDRQCDVALQVVGGVAGALEQRLGGAGRVDHDRAAARAGTAWPCRSASTPVVASCAGGFAPSGFPSTCVSGFMLARRTAAPTRGSARRAPRSRRTGRSSRRPARAARRRRHAPPRRPPPRRRSRSPQRWTGTPAGSRSAAIDSLASPIRYTASQRPATGSRSSSNPPPFRLPPAIRWTPPSNASIPTRADATLVAFESFTHVTPARRRHLLEAVRHSGERAQCLGDRRGVEPARERRGGGGRGVLEVVPAAQPDLLRRHGQRRERRQDRDVAGTLVGEYPQLRVAVGLEGAVAVDVVRLDVQQHRALGRERNGVLELEARRLAHDDRVLPDRSDERRQRRPDVPGDRGRDPRRPVYRAEQLDRGRLAVRAGHRDELVRQQPPRQLHLADDLDAALAAATITGASFGTPGLFTRVRTPSSRSSPSLSRCASSPIGDRGPAAVHADHLAVLAQGEHRGGAGAREPDDEVGPPRERRARLHGIDC